MSKLVLAASAKSVINKDMITPRQFINIGLAQKKFNEVFANTNYRAEIVTSDNLNYNDLITLEEASDTRHAGFYKNRKPKFFLATCWVDDNNIYPNNASKKIFTSAAGKLTDRVSIGTFLGLDKKDLY